MKSQKFYKGFEFIDETALPDFNGKGIYLRHRKTKLEVFHLLNDDEENLFAFVVRTPNASSNGAAHITEHSVFCGSEKFPLKEPFTNLVNQSLNTFLNAMTYPDKTVYPASSLNKVDYFNLMDVYGDAVFFPLLSRETFMQEAHRLEVDDDGNISIQGVVYNEMKGAYSSFAAVAYDYITRSLQKGSIYEYDSGGDPLAIPDLTYEDFKAFYKKNYRPDNALLFLYGNIPTEEQLDFVQEKLLDSLEARAASETVSASGEACASGEASASGGGLAPANPPPSECLSPCERITPAAITAPVTVRATGPDSGVRGSYATLAWQIFSANDLNALLEAIFVMQVLAGHDGSPMSKALLDSGYGDGLLTEIENSFYKCSVTFGLSGVKEGAEDKIASLVLDVLHDIAENGTSQENIDAAILAVDFANQEVLRSGGPYSLELLSRVATGWNYGSHPATMLGYRAAFAKIKEKIADDKNYIQKLVHRLFIENAARSFVVVTPSAKYTEERAAQEKIITEKLAVRVTSEKIKQLQDDLHAYQYREETSEDASCIPHVSPKDISPERPPIITERESVTGFDGSDVQCFYNCEPTNGIVYVDVSFPVDNLAPDEYFYLPLFATCMFDTGWDGKNWAECLTEASLCTGDMAANLFSATASSTERALLQAKTFSEFNYIGRDWLTFRMKMPVEKTEEAFALFATAITCADFTDAARIKNLADDYYNGALEAIVPGASRFMNSRTVCRIDRTQAVTEIWRGLSQVYRLKTITKECDKNIGERFGELLSKIMSFGAIVHVTADSESLEKTKPCVKNFVAQAKLKSLSPRIERLDSVWFDLVKLPSLNADELSEAFTCDTQVGCASAAIKLNTPSIKEHAALEVLSHWLSSNGLWSHIRTAGGAYGAFSEVNARNNFFRLYSYRDPQPERSLSEFAVCIKEACDADLSEHDVERAVTGTYGDLVQPSSPSGRGTLGLRRILCAVCEEDLLDLRKSVLAVTKKDIRMAAEQIFGRIKETHTAIFSAGQSGTTKNCIDIKNLT